MALFGNKKKVTPKAEKAAPAKARARKISSVIVKPHITEKAASQGDKGVYVFDVRRSATKKDVALAIAKLFNVTPVRVNIVNQAHRTTHSRARARRYTVSGAKKALVYLKKGDTINLF